MEAGESVCRVCGMVGRRRRWWHRRRLRAGGAAQDTYSGSQLWLHYVPVSDAGAARRSTGARSTAIVVENAGANKVHRHTANLSMAPGSTEKLVETSLEAARDELVRGLGGLLGPAGAGARPADDVPDGAVVVGTRESSATVRAARPRARTWPRSATRAT